MNSDMKKNEIISQMSACPEMSYPKKKYLSELEMLEKQTIDLTFKHESDCELHKLSDVISELRRRNEECGNIADSEVEKFEEDVDELNNLISAEISGNKGEKIVFDELNRLNCQNYVLHNVELEFDGRRVEIDALVITSHAVFVIEIKNSKKNIYIGRNGEFIRSGNKHSKCDGNIIRKMDMREAFVHKALERAGMENVKVFKIVTFTNTKIEFANEANRCLKALYSNQLAYFINNFKNNRWYSYEDICTMAAALNEAKCSAPYKMNVNMEGYKLDFANLLVKLETAETPTVELVSGLEHHTINNIKSKATNTNIKMFIKTWGKVALESVAVTGVLYTNLSLLNNVFFRE